MNEDKRSLALFRTALERGYDFVLIVESLEHKLALTQTMLDDKAEAKMLQKFARMAEKRARGE